jgi:hypothetical protein
MKHPRLFVILLSFALFIAAFTITASAQSPAPPAAPTSSAATTAPELPSTPASPTVPPTPSAPAARREETIEAPAPAANDTGVVEKRPTVFQRAAAYLQDREALAGEITSRDHTITDLRSQLAQRDQTIAAQNSELTELRAGRDQLQTAITRLESERTTVTNTIASLGFDQTKLPAAAALDQVAENSIEGLKLKLERENDDVKRSEIMSQMIALRDAPHAPK